MRGRGGGFGVFWLGGFLRNVFDVVIGIEMAERGGRMTTI